MNRSPFQTLCCVQPVDGQQPFLLAASGPVISSFNLKDGSLLDQWPGLKGANAQDEDAGTTNGDEGPPAKRRRMEDDGPAEPLREDTESIEIISERKKGERRKPKMEDSKLPNVTNVIVTSNAATVITVTAEDKSINVFSVDTTGVLNLQSQR